MTFQLTESKRKCRTQLKRSFARTNDDTFGVPHCFFLLLRHCLTISAQNFHFFVRAHRQKKAGIFPAISNYLRLAPGGRQSQSRLWLMFFFLFVEKKIMSVLIVKGSFLKQRDYYRTGVKQWKVLDAVHLLTSEN